MRRGQQTNDTCPTCGARVYRGEKQEVFCGNEPDCDFSRLSPSYRKFKLLVHKAEQLTGNGDDLLDDMLDCRDDLILTWLGLSPVETSNNDLSATEVS